MSDISPATPGRTFISYRREETAYPAGWLYDRLADRFGDSKIFKDIDSIELGDDFVEVITTAVGSCDVLLALIGNEWLTITDENGRRRLDDPGDFVRLEIEAALARDVRVIPVLVDGAGMPRAEDLPASLAKLVRRQALELSPNRFDFDTGRLLRVLEGTLSEVQAQNAATTTTTAPVSTAPDKGLVQSQPPPSPEPSQVPTPTESPGATQAPPSGRGRGLSKLLGRLSTRTRIAAVGASVVLVVAVVLVIVANSDTAPESSGCSSDGAPSISSPNGSTTTLASSREAIFMDDFSGTDSGWQEYGESPVGAHYGNDVYRICVEPSGHGSQNLSSPENAERVYPNAPESVEISVDARRTTRTSDTEGYGLICRRNGNSSFYLFAVSDGYVTIAKLTPTDPFYIGLTDGAAPETDSNATIRIQATCTTNEQKGVRLVFSVDGETVATAVDSDNPYLTGTVGLAVGEDGGASGAEFDNFVVTQG